MSQQSSQVSKSTRATRCQGQRCLGTTSRGQQCKRSTIEPYCYLHKSQQQETVVEEQASDFVRNEILLDAFRRIYTEIQPLDNFISVCSDLTIVPNSSRSDLPINWIYNTYIRPGTRFCRFNQRSFILQFLNLPEDPRVDFQPRIIEEIDLRINLMAYFAFNRPQIYTPPFHTPHFNVNEYIPPPLPTISEKEMDTIEIIKLPTYIDECHICLEQEQTKGHTMECCKEKKICYGCIKDLVQGDTANIVKCPFCRRETNFYKLTQVLY